MLAEFGVSALPRALSENVGDFRSEALIVLGNSYRLSVGDVAFVDCMDEVMIGGSWVFLIDS